MTPLHSSTRALAQRLLDIEAAAESDSASEHPAHETVRVADKLRASLMRFAGPDGFAALLRRAVKLARADVPAMEAVTVQPDGSLEGLDSLPGRWTECRGHHHSSAQSAGHVRRQIAYAATDA